MTPRIRICGSKTRKDPKNLDEFEMKKCRWRGECYLMLATKNFPWCPLWSISVPRFPPCEVARDPFAKLAIRQLSYRLVNSWLDPIIYPIKTHPRSQDNLIASQAKLIVPIDMKEAVRGMPCDYWGPRSKNNPNHCHNYNNCTYPKKASQSNHHPYAKFHRDHEKIPRRNWQAYE